MNGKSWFLIAAISVIVLSCVAVYSLGEYDADESRTIDAIAIDGMIVDSDNTEYKSGVLNESITLKFIPNPGYEFIRWNVTEGADYKIDGSTITITAVTKKTTVTAMSRNVSSSQGLTYIVDSDGMPIPGETLVKSWSFASKNLDKNPDPWVGMPSTPLIVGDLAYIRAGGYLYAVDVTNGVVRYFVESVTAKAEYYHYVSYGEGVIIDTTGHKAYDLELNYLYDIPSDLKYAVCYNGYAYGFSFHEDKAEEKHYQMFKMSLEPGKDFDENGVKKNLLKEAYKTRAWAQYGQYSTPIFKDGWMFFLEANSMVGESDPSGRVCYRALTAVNVETEEFKVCELDDLKGIAWDDGWLTNSGDYFYVTAYAAGLFDNLMYKGKNSCIQYVKFDFNKGEFVEESKKCVDIQTPDGKTFRGIASPFIVHNGRGYVNVKAYVDNKGIDSDETVTSMIAYDVLDDGTLIPTETCRSLLSHGGLVMNVAYEKDGKIFIYLLPYENNKQAIYVFTDELIDGKWTLKDSYTKIEPTRMDWGSQGVRVGPNGEVIYYVDSGYIDCYVSADKNKITVVKIDGNNASISAGCGLNAGVVIGNLYTGALVNGNMVTIGDKTYKIYGLDELRNSWNDVNNIFTDEFISYSNSGSLIAPYNYVILLEENTTKNFYPKGEAGWYYYKDGDYEKCILYRASSLDSVIGYNLTFCEKNPDGLLLASEINVPYNDSATLNTPIDIENCVVADGNIVDASFSGNVLTVIWKGEGQTTIQLTLDHKQYTLNVVTLPKVEIDEDGNTVVTSDKTVEGDNGEKTQTKRVTTTNADKNKVEEKITKITTDSNGNVLNTSTSVENRISSVDEDGNKTTESEVKTTVVDSNGKESLIEESTISTTYELNGGTNKTETFYTKFEGNNSMQVRTTQYVNGGFSFINVLTETYSGQLDTLLSSDTKYEFTNTSPSMDIRFDDKMVWIIITGEDADTSGIVPISTIEDLSEHGYDVVSEVPLRGDMIGDLVKIGAKLTLKYGTSSIVLEGNSLENVSDKGTVAFTTTKVNSDDLNDSMKNAAGNASVYNITLTAGDITLTEFGKFTITINSIADGDRIPRVWRIDEDGSKTMVDDVKVIDGNVVFTTNHLSYYAVSYEQDEGSGLPVTIAAVAVALVIIMGLVVWKFKRAA